MGSAKLALIGCVYTILNLYTFSFNTADNTSATAAYTAGNTVQGEQLAKVGVSLAIVKMGNDATPGWISSSCVTMGSTVSYTVRSIPFSSDKKITSSATLGNVSTTMIAIAHYDSGKKIWRISKIYSQASVQNNV